MSCSRSSKFSPSRSSMLVFGRGLPRAVGGRRGGIQVQALDVVSELDVGLDELAAGCHARIGPFLRGGRAREPFADSLLDVTGDPFHELVGASALEGLVGQGD